MNLAILVLILLSGISLLLMANKHGKPKTGDENFWITFIGTIIQWGILWWAGLFTLWYG